MDKVSETFTVFFEDPFWVGVFERTGEGRISVCKVTFGPEPKDYELYDFILRNFTGLRFSPPVLAAEKENGCKKAGLPMPENPKRRQREAQKLIGQKGVGTKSQLALKAWQEQQKTERKAVNRMQREQEKQLKFEQKQQKRKEKHRGR